MRSRLLAILAVATAAVSPAVAQEQNSEIIQVSPDMFLRWYGHADRTYFIQVSDPNDHLRKWTWAPIIETGNDEDISYEVDGTADKGFFRLWFSDQPTTDPDGDDFDYDGLTNWDEVSTHQTNPLKWDSDDDGLPDDWEIAHALDPNDDGSDDPANGANGDPDGDGLTNEFEYWYYADPNLADTDGDGLNDFDEVFVYYTYPDSTDTDWDGLDDYAEIFTYGTDPWWWDTDEDTLSDGDEVLTHGTNPLEMDTDRDWMWDDWELANSLDPADAADGLLDADSDTLANQLEFVFLDQGYDPFVANNVAAFTWNGDPDFDGLTTTQEFSTYLTNPRQPDTDDDGMDDGWEIQYGFSALVHNGRDAAPDNDEGADPDGDGIGNGQESSQGTNPNNVDSDGDGVSDTFEIGQGTNPNDPNDYNPPPKGTVAVNITFGDHSGSHSEKYRVKLQPVEGDTQVRTRTNRKYGETQTDTLRLRKGARYTVTLEHVATDPKYRDDPKPDYDYTLEIPQVAATEQTLRIIKDPQGIFGVHDESDSFFASGKTADLFVMHFRTETVSAMPTNSDRKKLGVREESEVTVTPSSTGTINWSLVNQKDATVNPATGYSVMFQADTRTKDTTLRATFDTGDIYNIVWNVVQPTGERARKTADLTYAAGTQGAGMTLEYTTLPDDVSFYQVEVLEVDKGTSNVTGFFTFFGASPLQHHPNPSWITLSQENMWGDTAAFFGWGFSPSSGNTPAWANGIYQWDIDVMWRTVGEGGNGLLLGTRTQLHTLHDSTGQSTESKSGESSTRTP